MPIDQAIIERLKSNDLMLANVQQMTIKPIIESVINAGTKVYTDEYAIYAWLSEWRYERKTVSHGVGKFAREEDGDSFP